MSESPTSWQALMLRVIGIPRLVQLHYWVIKQNCLEVLNVKTQLQKLLLFVVRNNVAANVAGRTLKQEGEIAIRLRARLLLPVTPRQSTVGPLCSGHP